MKSTVIIVFWIVSLASAWAQQPCRTQVFDKLIHSLQVHVADQLMSIPCIEAGSDQQIEISFDALSPQAVRYAYSIVHAMRIGHPLPFRKSNIWTDSKESPLTTLPIP